MVPAPDRLLFTPASTAKAALRLDDPYVSRSLAGTPVLDHGMRCSESVRRLVPTLMARYQTYRASPQPHLADGTGAPVLLTPSRILDAPGLEDDFYLNLLDWCPGSNQLAVGLAGELFMWSATTGKVTPIVRLPGEDCVTAVCWVTEGVLAMGTKAGRLELIDIERVTRLLAVKSHSARIAVLANKTNDTHHLLSSGGRDRSIVHYDTRCLSSDPAADPMRSSIMVGRVCGAHQQEVCGLRWEGRPGGLLASGGNDNQLFVWDARQLANPLLSGGAEHTAAIKALAWSPHQRGLLASGGGTADRTVKFWCARTSSAVSPGADPTPMSPLQSTLTSSQVCNMLWSPHSSELVTAHGFSEHQCVRWSYPSMEATALLRGHEQRVLYMALSSDGTTIVTGSGDETLRFWSVFNATGDATGGRRTKLWAKNRSALGNDDHMNIV